LVSSIPLISVVVPVHNHELYVRQAVESILGQTYEALQVIVVDDGSTDGTPSVLATLSEAAATADSRRELRVVRQRQTGRVQALNRGVDLATGSMLAFLDADDLWMPDKLKRQAKALATAGPSALVFGWVRQFHSPELTAAQRARIACPGPGPGISRCTMLCYRETFARVGHFDPGLRLGEFLDWYARAKALGMCTSVLEVVVLLRRLHTSNSTRGDTDLREYARVLARARQRARQTVGSVL
jgi:glycosyltransferase involved in cell wall biosynthesis